MTHNQGAALTLLLLVVASGALGGCAVEIAPQFGGEKSQIAAEAAVRTRFPVGTPLEDVRSAMATYGYSCRDFAATRQLSAGLECFARSGMAPAPAIQVGGFWRFCFFAEMGKLTKLLVLNPYSKYS